MRIIAHHKLQRCSLRRVPKRRLGKAAHQELLARLAGSVDSRRAEMEAKGRELAQLLSETGVEPIIAYFWVQLLFTLPNQERREGRDGKKSPFRSAEVIQLLLEYAHASKAGLPKVDEIEPDNGRFGEMLQVADDLATATFQYITVASR